MLLALFLLSLTRISDSLTGSCNTYWKKYGSTFNVCPLMIQSNGQDSYYTVNDARYKNDPDVGVRYYFNIANSVLEYPSSVCKNLTTGPCTQYSSDTVMKKCLKEDPVTWKTWAYSETYNKKDNSVTECKHLSNNKKGDQMSIDLYSISVSGSQQLDPTEGIKVKVINGDFNSKCPYSDHRGENQWFELILECADDYNNVPDDEMVFYIPDRCQYYTKMKSVYGCPAECGTYNKHLCAGNGICGFDFTNTQPKCMCYQGNSGTNCATNGDSSVHVIPAVNTEVPNPQYSHIFPQVKGKVTYDLSAAHLQNGDFTILDQNSKWIYLLDLDSMIDPDILPEVCKTKAGLPCKTFGNDNTCTEYENIPIGQGIAFRYNAEQTECQLLATDSSFILYDENEPAKGISFMGTKGEFCGAANENRGGSLEFHCSNSPTTANEPPKVFPAKVLTEDPYDCKFTIWTETGIACPWNCLKTVNNGKGWNVCSLKGTCMFDPNAGYSRCICDHGYEGSNCETKTSNQSNVIIWNLSEDEILLIGIISLLVILIIISILFWRCYMKLNKKFTQLNKSLINSDFEDDKIKVKCNSLDAAGHDDSLGDNVDASSCKSDDEQRVLLN
eukprot:217581_1